MREGMIWEYTYIRGIFVGIDWLVADPGDPWHWNQDMTIWWVELYAYSGVLRVSGALYKNT